MPLSMIGRIIDRGNVVALYPNIPIHPYPHIPISRYPVGRSRHPDIQLAAPDIPISQYPEMAGGSGELSRYPDILEYCVIGVSNEVGHDISEY